MEGITKSKISGQQMDEMVKAAFGGEAGIEAYNELKDGFFNTAYNIRLSDGREAILKISPPSRVKLQRYEKGIMSTEVQVLRLLKNDGRVPVPQVYYYDTSKRIIENEYFFMEKIHGTTYNKIKENLTREQQYFIEEQVGRYTKHINGIKGECFGYMAPEAKKYPTWPEAFFGILCDVLEDGLEYTVELPESYGGIRELIRENLKLLEGVVQPGLVHWDLWDGNIFINEEELKVTGIIDCERALWGDPLMEYNFADMNDKTGFCAGYGRVMPETHEEKCRRAMYSIYLYLVMTIECSYRHYEDMGQQKWAYGMLSEEIKKLGELTVGSQP